MTEKVIVASLYGDPFHLGHLEYLKLSRRLGTSLIVIVNNDSQTLKKKGFVMLPVEERMEIIRELRCVTDVIQSVDEDGSVCKTLELVKRKYPNVSVFAKGGDRNRNNIPEGEICKKLGIEIVDGCGEKIQSSRKLVHNLQSSLVNVVPGYFEGN